MTSPAHAAMRTAAEHLDLLEHMLFAAAESVVWTQPCLKQAMLETACESINVIRRAIPRPAPIEGESK